MLRIVFLCILCCVEGLPLLAAVLNGYVRDAHSGEPLLFVTATDKAGTLVCSSDNVGYFTVVKPKGDTLLFSCLGYFPQQVVMPNNNHSLDIYLVPQVIDIESVTIQEHTPIHKQTLLGKTTMTAQEIKQLPTFLGTPDIMKALSTLPGVAGGRDGYSSLFVRGGDKGQNLILFDGIKLYGSNHVGGLVSLFNPYIVKQADIYKGGFPARYGGRASSVIDVYTIDGNKEKWRGIVDLGILNAGVAADGPVGSKSTLSAAVRTSYMDIINIIPAINYKRTGKGDFVGLNFFDVNLKFTTQLNPKHKLAIIGYSGHDFAYGTEKDDIRRFESSSLYRIHNTGVSIQHQYIITPQFFLRNAITYSRYQSNSKQTDLSYNKGDSTQTSYTNTAASHIQEINLRSTLDYYHSTAHQFKFGVEVSGYHFNPSLAYYYDSGIDHQKITAGNSNGFYAAETSLFAEDELTLFSDLKLNIGLRGVAYAVKDSTYFRLEPRVSFRWLVNQYWSWKVNYTLMNQFHHVVTQKNSLFEKETWMTATRRLPPQFAHQVSAGTFFSFVNNKVEFGLEGYYKTMGNLLEYNYLNFLNPLNTSDFEEHVVSDGKGVAYGLEFRNTVQWWKLQNTINYTLSWNYRQFPTLNNGQWYPFIYDRRHDFSMQTVLQLTSKWRFATNFVITTGSRVTLPTGYSGYDGWVPNYFIFESINNVTLPLYHRLDITASYFSKTKKGNTWSLVLNVYNVYNKHNPVYMYYDSFNQVVKGVALFTIVPTVTFTYAF